MPAWLAPAAITAGSAILKALTGGDTMSPERRRLFQQLQGELDQGDLGFSGSEKSLMGLNLKNSIQGQTQENIGSNISSLERRGMNTAGMVTGMTTAAQTAGGKAYGQGVNDIELASQEQARKRKAQIQALMAGLTPEADTGGVGDLSGLSSNLMQILMNKKKNDQASPMGDYSLGGATYA